MRDFTQLKRLVIKIGTSTISSGQTVNSERITSFAADINQLFRQGREIVIVTSGAIGMGAKLLGLSERPVDIRMRQACAAIGQPLVMDAYRQAFEPYKINIAQLLLTADVLNRRSTYLNLRHVFEKLFELKVIPIVNENDCVSTEEIGTAFGDNDRLSAYVASKIDAGLLILLSDIDGFYDRDPRCDPTAQKINTVFAISKEIEAAAGAKGSSLASGGMQTKLEAARIAARAGCKMVLADGSRPHVVQEILEGKPIGTLFLPRQRLSQRERWIVNSNPRGRIIIDVGALAALRQKKSLLPAGIKEVQGEFASGEVVWLNDVAKAVSSFSSAELKLLLGKHSTEIVRVLGAGKKDVVASPENIVFLD